jgi:chromosome segregation ATPase
VHASTKALEVQRDELTAKAQAIRSTTEAQKEQIRALKEQTGSLARSAEELRMAIEAKKSQIVSSPAKVKADVAGLASIVDSSQAALDSIEGEKRVLLRQKEVVAKATKDVNKAMTLMSEAEAEAVKLKRVLRDEKAQRAAAEALGGEAEALRATLGHAEASKRRVEEKLSTVREEGAAQVAAQARMLGAVRQAANEYLDDAKSASNARRSAENEKMRLEARKEALISKHSAEVSDILASVRHLSSSVGQYHTTLFSNLAAVNAISPIGGEREVAATGSGRGI